MQRGRARPDHGDGQQLAQGVEARIAVAADHDCGEPALFGKRSQPDQLRHHQPSVVRALDRGGMLENSDCGQYDQGQYPDGGTGPGGGGGPGDARTGVACACHGLCRRAESARKLHACPPLPRQCSDGVS